MILTSILSNFLWLDLRESFTLADISKNVCQILHLKRKWSRDRFGIHFWRCRPSKKLSEIYVLCITGTGKSLSEALIFASTNPLYDDRLFVKLQVQYMKIPSSNLGTGENMLCTEIVSDIHVLPRFELGIFMYLSNL